MATEPRAAFVEAMRGMLAACPCKTTNQAGICCMTAHGADNCCVCECFPPEETDNPDKPPGPCEWPGHALVRKAAEAFADSECGTNRRHISPDLPEHRQVCIAAILKEVEGCA